MDKGLTYPIGTQQKKHWWIKDKRTLIGMQERAWREYQTNVPLLVRYKEISVKMTFDISLIWSFICI